jgi:hypothetical protein
MQDLLIISPEQTICAHVDVGLVMVSVIAPNALVLFHAETTHQPTSYGAGAAAAAQHLL